MCLRRAIPPISGVDLSPIIALFVLNLVERFGHFDAGPYTNIGN